MGNRLLWSNERRKLRELVPWDDNPRTISKGAARRLQESWRRFGQVMPLAIGPNNEIYDGHQRKSVLELVSEFGGDMLVDVRVASRPLTREEQEQLTLLLLKSFPRH